jgi:dienelactone hydrolase
MGLRLEHCQAQSPFRVRPLEFTLPSAAPSGNPIDDRIWMTFYPAVQSSQQPAPAVVLLHALGETRMRMMGQFARYLAERGIGAAVMELPYHMHRRPPGVGSGGPFTDPDVNREVQAANQSASDVSTVVTWLSRQLSVDPRRIGVLGVSLGAMIAHLAMGKDERLSAGVAILGGGNLADLRRTSLVYKFRERGPPEKLSPQELERLEQVDPLHYASRNRPRRVLMIQAARDLLMPPRDARVLWDALGRPPIVWVDTNHFGLALTPRSVVRTSAAYLWSVWNEAPLVDPPLPAIDAITLKLGIIAGLGARPTPALQWQAYSFASRRNHMSLLHSDLGWSGRGPFIGLAGTVNGFIDLGLAHRFSGGGIRPYLSFHVVF